MKRDDPALDRLLRRQFGVVAKRQIAEIGVPYGTIAGRLRRGSLHRLLPGVYGDSSTPLDHGRLTAALLWAGPDATLVGSAAAFCWGMRAKLPDAVMISVPPERHLSRQPGVAVINERARCSTRHRGFRVASDVDTAVDLACEGSTDGFDWLARQRWFDRQELTAALDRRGNRRGVAMARVLLAESDTNPWSRAEREFHRRLLSADIRGWVANVTVAGLRERHLVDLRFLSARLVVEIDGREHHDTAAAFERDRRKTADLTAAGWTVLRFTWTQLINEAAWVLDMIRAALLRIAD